MKEPNWSAIVTDLLLVYKHNTISHLLSNLTFTTQANKKYVTKIFVQEVVKDVSVQIRGIFFVQGNEKECGESGAICNLIYRLLMNIYSVISVMCDV